MNIQDLITKLQEIADKEGNIPVEFALHSYTQVSPTVYLRSTPNISVAGDNVVRLTLHTGEDVRISILNQKVVAYVGNK